MNENPKYKTGQVLMLKMGIELENERSKYFRFFPKFIKHPLTVSSLDQKVLSLKPLRVEGFSYFMDLDEYYYELSTDLNGEKVKFRKLENFLVPPIVERVAYPDNKTRSELENQLVNGTYKERFEAANKVKETDYHPTSSKQGVNYYLHTRDFVTMTSYGEKAVMPLLEYLYVCSDEEIVPEIFAAFMNLGQYSINVMLHLLTVNEYEHRDLVYYVLGEVGNEKCIEFFEALKRQETKYMNELNEGLEKLRTRLK